MQPADRADFEAQMRKFCAGANLPPTDERIEAFWTGLAKMALHEFVRATDHLLALEEWSFPRKPGALWGVVRELKAQHRPVPLQPLPERQWHGDKWDRAANLHLFGHVARQARRGVHYASQHMRTYPIPQQADQESVDLVYPLLKWKRTWSEEMREADAAGALPADHGRATWEICMKSADAEVDTVREKYSRKVAA